VQLLLALHLLLEPSIPLLSSHVLHALARRTNFPSYSPSFNVRCSFKKQGYRKKKRAGKRERTKRPLESQETFWICATYRGRFVHPSTSNIYVSLFKLSEMEYYVEKGEM
jgi:hypothetical protein